MRALLVENYAPVETLSICDVPSPQISPGFVRVRVKAAGIGFVEALKIAGRYQTKDPLPFVPGTEFAGVVEEVGDGLEWPKVGEQNAGHSTAMRRPRSSGTRCGFTAMRRFCSRMGGSRPARRSRCWRSKSWRSSWG
jgi:NADPH:quinone reductase-like Zn-dependent oxidoreductase